MAMADKTILDALRLAQTDPNFAMDLVTNAEKHASEYNLSSKQIEELSKAKHFVMETMRSAVANLGGGQHAAAAYQ
jgi:hypothetical protein